MASQDNIFRDKLEHVSDFQFNQEVAQVFPNMIERSVPGYSLLIDMFGLIAASFLKHGDVCYDLGCSLGACSQKVLRHVGKTEVRVVAVDSSTDMLGRAKQLLADPRVTFQQADLREFKTEHAQVVMLNLVLQFIEPEDRTPTLKQIHDNLKPGGVTLIAEKVIHSKLLTDLHINFKRSQGYSELEIAQKRTALENVMLPESSEMLDTRLHEAGFNLVEQWYQCLNWVAYLAIK